jgi:hypothetical protein
LAVWGRRLYFVAALVGEEFGEVGVWSVGYAASPSKWQGLFAKGDRDAGHSMALPDRALQMLDRMAQIGVGQRPFMR